MVAWPLVATANSTSKSSIYRSQEVSARARGGAVWKKKKTGEKKRLLEPEPCFATPAATVRQRRCCQQWRGAVGWA